MNVEYTVDRLVLGARRNGKKVPCHWRHDPYTEKETDTCDVYTSVTRRIHVKRNEGETDTEFVERIKRILYDGYVTENFRWCACGSPERVLRVTRW